MARGILDDKDEAQGDVPARIPSESEEKLLKRIRDDFRYCRDYWRENREESATDMLYASADGWTNEEKQERAGRPCLWPDELSQYLKQANNNLRQNKRSIKVKPKGSGATDKDARHRAAYIRGIEYASSAQAIYTTAFECCTECAFGFWRIITKITGQNGEQEPRLRRIPNPFTVYPDPDAKEADFSDAEICFVTDSLRKDKFAKKYPKARKKSFTTDDSNVAPDWFDGENIVIAEYWTAEGEYPDRKVTQYITNGVEILETNKWIGSWIPIIGVFGEEIYVKEGGKSKRKYLSLIRRARGPQKMLAYIASQMQEEFGMQPRAPRQGYKGQFGDERWASVHKVPYAYLETNIPDDWNTTWGPPPLPTQPQYIINIQAYEHAYEQWRRSVQASMGITPLPTSAQRQNEKSGVALDKIQTQEAIGSFHFQDNFDRAVQNTCRQLNELITKLGELDSLPGQLAIRDKTDEHALIHAISSGGQAPADVDEDDYLVHDRGEFDVTISVGPWQQSQREEASNFVDVLIANLGKLPLPPNVQAELIGLAVKLKNIGPIGEEIAELLIPPKQEGMPPQAQAAIQQAQGIIQQLQQELQKLSQEKEAKVVEMQFRKEIEAMKTASSESMKRLDNDLKIALAEISTKAQDARERREFVGEFETQMHGQAHEVALQAHDHAHEKELADQQHAQALEQQEQAGQQAQDQQQTQIEADQQNQQESQ